MTNEKFREIAARAEELARKNPSLYRARLVAMATCGYGFLLLLLFLLLGVLVGLLVLMVTAHNLHGGLLKLVFVLGALTLLLLRSLWVKLEAPKGITLKEATHPELFVVIERARAAANAPHPHSVVLDGEFNASVSQVPRLGLFGWYRNQLTIGLPLMEGLTPDEFCSVLAHEFGHLSGAHGKMGVWLYRVRQTWLQVVQNFARSGSSMTKLLLPFFKWFVPRFSAYSMAQMRQHEYEADRCAARASGTGIAVQALMRVNVLGAWLNEKFWSQVYKQADHIQQPIEPLSTLPDKLREFTDVAAVSHWLQRSLRQETEGEDTHPALRDRLAALTGDAEPVSDDEIDQRANRLTKPEASAASVFLGTHVPEMARYLDDMWKIAIGPQWRQRHVEVNKQREALKELDEKNSRGPLGEEDQWNRAWLTEELAGEDAALPLYQAILEQQPGHGRARFAIGRIMLGRKDSKGVAMIEDVMSRDPDARLAGYQILIAHFFQQGEIDRVKDLRRRAEEVYEVTEAAQEERSGLTDKDEFKPHDLPPESVAAVLGKIEETGRIQRAWLMLKVVIHNPEKPCRVLLVQRKNKPLGIEGSAIRDRETTRLANDLAEAVTTISPDILVYAISGSSPLFRKAKRVPNAQIFGR